MRIAPVRTKSVCLKPDYALNSRNEFIYQSPPVKTILDPYCHSQPLKATNFGTEKSRPEKPKDDSVVRYLYMKSKSDLPTKICAVCQRPFSWRKKWERSWEEVRYCSDRCRSSKPTGKMPVAAPTTVPKG